jgi:hypothetical protein
MKKRINLLSRHKNVGISEELAQRVRLIGTIIGIVLFLGFISTVVLQILLFQENQKLLEEKRGLLEYLLQNKPYETKFAYFNTKTAQMKKYLQDDAEFYPYYTLLNNLLNTASQGAALQKMNIDKNKFTQFSIKFNSLENAYTFIRYLESPFFLDNFNDLTLNSFSLIQTDNSIAKNYELTFSGKFKLIQNGKNL